MMLPLLLLGCDPFPEKTDVPNVSDDCSGEIFVPVGLLQGEAMAAQPHEETYGSSPAPFAVHQGLPSRDPSVSRSFLWQTDVGTLASSLVIGPADTFPTGATTYEGGSFLFGSAELGVGDYRQHEVRVCVGLQPQTTYTYRVGGEGGWSPEYSFTTPGTPGTFDSFRVAMFGDSRGDVDTWSQVITAVDEAAPDLMITSGDMVELGASQIEWDNWFAASGDVMARRPLAITHGNHEFLAQGYFAQVGMPGNEEWYALDWGPLHLVALNDTVRDPTQIGSDQVQFMRAEYQTATADWRWVVHHQPAYSTCTTHGSFEALREYWTPVWEESNVDLVVAGHNHIYERSVPILANAEAEGGVTYLVTGGAGAPLYEESQADWFGLKANPVNHYVIADFSTDRVDLVVYDLAGNVIDSFSLAH